MRRPFTVVVTLFILVQLFSFYAPSMLVRVNAASVTSTSVFCSPNPASATSPVYCTATVYGANATGNVAWYTSSSTGFFTSALTPLIGGVSTTTYYDNNTGHKIITASYLGDLNNYPSNGSTVLTVYVYVGVGTNLTVQPTEFLTLTFEYVSIAGLVIDDVTPAIRYPPLAGVIGPYHDIIVTAVYSGNVAVGLAFDGSNMTYEQKINLRMMEYTPLLADVSGVLIGVPDGVVNMRDIAYLISRFGTTPESPNWDPYADIYGSGGLPDGVVNMRDIGFAILCFNQRSSWVDITWYVDTVQNVVHGQTNHFSLIGIR